jgi:hypothetical protein
MPIADWLLKSKRLLFGAVANLASTYQLAIGN